MVTQNGEADCEEAVKRPAVSSPSVPTTTVTPPPIDDPRPRHFASYHPIRTEGDHGDSAGGGGRCRSSSRKPVPFHRQRSPSSRGTSPLRSSPAPAVPPAAPDCTRQRQRQRPHPGFLTPDGSREPQDAPVQNIYPTVPSTLKPTLSLTSIRAQQYHSLRHDKLPASATPFSSGTGTATHSLQNYRRHHPEFHFGDAPRSSQHSATTRSSSVEPVSATERSSIVTKASSMTDLSPEAPGDDGGMSVDDAIAMYLDGFADDPIPETPEESSGDSGDGPQDSVTGTAATPADSDKQPEPPRRDVPPRSPPIPTAPSPVTHHETVQEASVQETEKKPSQERATRPTPPLSQNKFVLPDVLSVGVPPPLSVATAERDEYGFQKWTAHITIEQYDSWYSSYSNYVDVRRQKWVDMLTSSGLQHAKPAAFPSRSSKIKRFVRKGIPPELRGPAWFWYADGYSHLHRNPGLYRRLVEAALKRPMNDDKEHIERDLHRTFPDNIHFKPQTPSNDATESDGNGNTKAPETPIIHSLRRVLYAFSVHNPKIGYTQSLNFIAGMLLLFLPEEKAFWLLHIITTIFLPGTHEISLEGANADLWILMVVLKESTPAIYTKVASSDPTTPKSKPPAITTTTRLPDITLGLTNWLMSMFISSLPLETTLRVWDILFYEGPRTFFRVALAIFRLSQKEILVLGDPMEIFQLVQTAPKQMIDPNPLIDESFARRFRLSQARLDSLRASRREAIKADTQRLSQLAAPGKLRAGTDGRPGTGPGNRFPGAWRSLKSHLR